MTVQTGFHKGGRNEILWITRVVARSVSTVNGIELSFENFASTRK